MSSTLSRFMRMLMLMLMLGLATARPAAAQEQGPSILRDTETEALFDEVAKPLVQAAMLDPKSVKVVLLNDSEINAFVAAIAAGAGDAGMGLMMMGQQAAMNRFLAFTRAQETSADLAGVDYLSKAGISGRGSLEFFKKLQNQEYRLAIYAKDSYDRTHPLSQERIQALSEVYQKDAAWNRPTEVMRPASGGSSAPLDTLDPSATVKAVAFGAGPDANQP
jgi:predicted Zn-dependent protease